MLPTPHGPAPPLQKAESEELETQKPQVKLRRTVSEVVRPASTPPIIASAIKDDDDEDRIIAELEVSTGGACGMPRLTCTGGGAHPALSAHMWLHPAPGTCSNTLGSGPGKNIPQAGPAAGFCLSPVSQQERGDAGLDSREQLHPAGPLAGSRCCVSGSLSRFSTSTTSWALKQFVF